MQSVLSNPIAGDGSAYRLTIPQDALFVSQLIGDDTHGSDWRDCSQLAVL